MRAENSSAHVHELQAKVRPPLCGKKSCQGDIKQKRQLQQLHAFKYGLCGAPGQLTPHPDLGTAGETDEVERESEGGEEGQTRNDE